MAGITTTTRAQSNTAASNKMKAIYYQLYRLVKRSYTHPTSKALAIQPCRLTHLQNLRNALRHIRDLFWTNLGWKFGEGKLKVNDFRDVHGWYVTGD